MTLPDLTITSTSGESHSYFALQTPQTATQHTKSVPDFRYSERLDTSPAQAGGQYDMRDATSDKALAQLDWTGGSLQSTLDSPNSTANRFLSSVSMNTRKAGELTLSSPVAHVPSTGVTGPVFAALEKLWLGYTAGGVKSTPDNGATWSTYALTGSPNGVIGDFASEGANVYVCIPGGTVPGVWRITAAGVVTKWSSAVGICSIAYNGGYLYGSTNSGAGIFDNAGAYTQVTPAFMTGVTTTNVDLQTAGNGVYWVMTQGGKSYAYQLTKDVGQNAYATQFAEYPNSFVATCSVGYLSMVYVGGYFESSTAGVGQGCVYVNATNTPSSAPLFQLGCKPEETSDPSSVQNDNRIFALAAGVKDLYVCCNRAVYRWDLDGAGLSHCFDLDGSMLGNTQVNWNAGSLISWDCSSLTSGPHPKFHPNAWTVTPDTEASWTFTEHTGANWYAQLTGAAQVWTATTPTTGGVDPQLSNASGSTLELKMPTDLLGTGKCDVSLRDGAQEGYITIWDVPPSDLYYYGPYIELHRYVPTYAIHTERRYEHTYPTNIGPYWVTTAVADGLYAWTDDSAPYANQLVSGMNLTREVASGRYVCDNSTHLLNPGCGGTVRLTMQATQAIVSLNGDPATQISTNSLHATSATNQLQLSFATGFILDNLSLNSTSSTGAGEEIEVLNHAGIAYSRGSVMCPYSCTAGQGYAHTVAGFAAYGELVSSPTMFHTGSMPKDFRHVIISHDALPMGSSVTCDWWLDGNPGSGTAVLASDGTHTLVEMNVTGSNMQTRLRMTSDATQTFSPRVTAITTYWDFVRAKVNTYWLDCATGAGGNSWGEDPETALRFVWACADEQALYADRLHTYVGSIHDLQFTEAAASVSEGLSGIVQIAVREVPV